MAWVFVLGVILGSFYNVLIIRTLNGESIIFPPSHCMSCDTPIEWRYKIPILSYLFLKGKCKYCKKNRYPAKNHNCFFLNYRINNRN